MPTTLIGIQCGGTANFIKIGGNLLPGCLSVSAIDKSIDVSIDSANRLAEASSKRKADDCNNSNVDAYDERPPTKLV